MGKNENAFFYVFNKVFKLVFKILSRHNGFAKVNKGFAVVAVVYNFNWIEMAYIHHPFLNPHHPAGPRGAAAAGAGSADVHVADSVGGHNLQLVSAL